MSTPPLPEPLPHAGMPPPRFIDVDGVRTCYYDVGTGPSTVVLIYGGNFGTADSASSAYVWSLTLAALAPRHRVIAFDKLGQGFTGPPLRDEDYTMSAVVRHASALVRKLELPPFHVVGHSRGGFAATRMTLEMQQQVRSLTICSSGTLSTGVGTNEVVLAMPPFPSGSREAARWIYENYCARAEHVDDAWIDAVEDVLRNPDYQAGVRKYGPGMLGVGLFVPELSRLKRETLTWIEAGRLQRPVQMIWGAQDRTVPIERGLELYELIAAHERRTTFSAINEAGHFTFREQPHRFHALLASFIEACEATV
jgi:pimeloyl-ACP methyl ester carboxylesterase